jgi:hypothetical protein
MVLCRWVCSGWKRKYLYCPKLDFYISGANSSPQWWVNKAHTNVYISCRLRIRNHFRIVQIYWIFSPKIWHTLKQTQTKNKVQTLSSDGQRIAYELASFFEQNKPAASHPSIHIPHHQNSTCLAESWEWQAFDHTCCVARAISYQEDSETLWGISGPLPK